MKRNHIVLLFSLFFESIYLTSCGMDSISLDWDNYDEDSGPTVTEILRVEFKPNPAIAGEMMTFTCIIKDSLSSDFYFVWTPNINSPLRPLPVTTEINSYEVKAPKYPGNYTGRIVVGAEDRYELNAVKKFRYTVIWPPGHPFGKKIILETK